MNIEKVKEVILSNLVESDFGDFLIDRKFYSPKFGCDTINNILSELSALAELEKPGDDIEKAYQVLAVYGVTKERAKTIANGIDVLETRYRKDRNCFEGEKQFFAVSYHAKKCAECVEKFTCETCGNKELNGCKGCYLSDGNISNNWKPHAL